MESTDLWTTLPWVTQTIWEADITHYFGLGGGGGGAMFNLTRWRGACKSVNQARATVFINIKITFKPEMRF